MASSPPLNCLTNSNPIDTHPNRDGSKSPEHERHLPDPDRLAPEDAYFAPALSRVRSAPANYEESLRSMNGENTSHIGSAAALRKKLGGAPRRRKRKGAWKKLLWVKQSCMFTYNWPTLNYTMLTLAHRPGQLHRYRNLSRPPSAQSTSTAV